jgi:hypothetical protein
MNLADDPSLPLITRDAGEHGEEQDSIHRRIGEWEVG